ncbi:MAG: hypothetical protein H6641_04645 [Caldilineaceae bacterium]|nr:hypothetical protein [Caldilineaceae bacterium]
MPSKAQIVIPPESELYESLYNMAAHQRMVFFAGLPGVGKSLFLQQLALMAHEAGRTVHLLQWDVTRPSFETPDILARYPEVDGVTHAAIRKGVGLWARGAIQRWHERHGDLAHLLIGEVPLVGNRLIELTQRTDDAVEALLAGAQTRFAIPTPSRAVRQVIEAAREASMSNPQHEKERADAPPHVLRAMWDDLYQLAQQLHIAPPNANGENVAYDPAIYAGVYQHLLQHRQTIVLPVDNVLPKVGSVYDIDAPIQELHATAAEAIQCMQHIQNTFTDEQLAAQVKQWYNA